MKRILLLIFALFTVFALPAQEETNSKKEKIKEPVIEFEETTHDYGVIAKGSDGMCEFKFKNVGEAPLQLTKVFSSCGCTVPSWTSEEIEPGKTGMIKVKYNTNNPGTINKGITVESNAKNDRIVLYIKGQVVEKKAEAAPENAPSQMVVPQ